MLDYSETDWAGYDEYKQEIERAESLNALMPNAPPAETRMLGGVAIFLMVITPWAALAILIMRWLR